MAPSIKHFCSPQGEMNYDRRDAQRVGSSAPKTEVPGHRWFQKEAADWTKLAPPLLGNYASHTSPNQWMGHALLQEALNGGATAHELCLEGTFSVEPHSLIPKIEALFKVTPAYIVHGHTHVIMFSSQDTMVNLTIELGGSGRIELVTSDLTKIETLAKLQGAVFIPDNPKEGFVYALGKQPMGGYSLVRVGTAGEPLERGNYTTDVVADYDHITQDLRTGSPCGRLIILAGPPGTGKTPDPADVWTLAMNLMLAVNMAKKL